VRKDAELFSIAPLVRACIKKEFGGKDTPLRTLSVPHEAYLKFSGYAERKRLGSVDVFASFAMEQYMTRYPLKTAPKSPGMKSIGD
jgi:hypothetical protein